MKVCIVLIENFLRKNVATRGPEARLYMACVAAVLLPTGMFIYAWCSFTFVHWIGQCIGITVRQIHSFACFRTLNPYCLCAFRYSCSRHSSCISLFSRILRTGAFLRISLCKSLKLTSVITYNSYGAYASSALAGQSLLRESPPPFSEQR